MHEGDREAVKAKKGSVKTRKKGRNGGRMNERLKKGEDVEEEEREIGTIK